MKVIVTGASGLLGRDIADVFEEAGHKTIRLLGRKDIDITDTRKVIGFIEQEMPDCVIHCAGYRDLDDIEDHKIEGYTINTLGSRNIALACESIGCKMVYISSDTVFDGEKEEGYHEFDQVNPVNTYGKSKLIAENEVKSLCKRFFIIRTALLFGYKGHRENNFIFHITDSIKNGKTIYANENQICSPSYTKDLGEAILRIADSAYYGTYHVANSGVASRYDVSRAVAELAGLPADAVAASDAAGSGKKAKRSRNTVFQSITFDKTYGYTLRHWKEALADCIASCKMENLI